MTIGPDVGQFTGLETEAMKPFLRTCGLAILALGMAIAVIGETAAQVTPGAAQPLPESTVRALQEALNKQGIAVTVDGKISDGLRGAIRKYQSQHHLPVTGEPDKATLDKLGVALPSAAAPGGVPAAGSMPGQDKMMGPGMMGGGMMGGGMMGGGMTQGGQGMPPAKDMPGR